MAFASFRLIQPSSSICYELRLSTWEKFCAWIVEEYGTDENLDPEE
jgi:hypothetical protein